MATRYFQLNRLFSRKPGKSYFCHFSPYQPFGWNYLSGITIASTLFTLSLVTLPRTPGIAQPAPTPMPEPIIHVGIVQRFGADSEDQLLLQPLSGDRLTLQFKTGEQLQTVTTTTTVKLDIIPQTLPEPELQERVVLSTHRSFESAEDSANRWRSQGIEVEIAQPRQWQVWAKRDTYRSPLLRRLLLQNLRSHGSTTAFIDSQLIRQIPEAAFVVNGYRYQRDELTITSANRRIYVGKGANNRDRRLYGGSLRLQPNSYGTYTLVNQVPIETYLRGVVPHEIGLGAPRTTIEAQAILARTYALRNLRRFAIDNYQLCADTQCQVYWGLTGAAAVSDRAIAATRNLVLTHQNELVDALYSSTTGGITAPFADVWNGANRPYLQAVVDSVSNVWDLARLPLSEEQNLRTFISKQDGFNEVGWDMFRWRVESSLPKIEADLKEYLQNRQHPMANFGQVEELRVVERSPAGRVLKLAIDTNQGVIQLEKDEILRAVEAPNSTLFYLEPIYAESTATANSAAVTAAIPDSRISEQGQEPSARLLKPAIASPQKAIPSPIPQRILKGYAFVGGGLGHGVGMSQTGAYHLGDLGWSATRILNFYYPNTRIQPLNRTITFWSEPTP